MADPAEAGSAAGPDLHTVMRRTLQRGTQSRVGEALSSSLHVREADVPIGSVLTVAGAKRGMHSSGVARGRSAFNFPCGLTFLPWDAWGMPGHEDMVLVADSSNNRLVRYFVDSGEFDTLAPVEPEQLTEPVLGPGGIEALHDGECLLALPSDVCWVAHDPMVAAMPPGVCVFVSCWGDHSICMLESVPAERAPSGESDDPAAGVARVRAARLCGGGRQGLVNGVGTQARLMFPRGVVVLPLRHSPDGCSIELVFADMGNHMLRRASVDFASRTARVAPFAGFRAEGSGLVDGPFEVAAFVSPSALCLSACGDALFVGQTGALRRVDLVRRTVRTLAGQLREGFLDGTGLEAMLGEVGGLCVAYDGSLVFTDSTANRIRRLRHAEQSRVPGPTCFVSPLVEPHSRLLADGLVTTLAGTGARGKSDGRRADLVHPFGVCADEGTRLFFSDFGSHCLRMLRLAWPHWTAEGHATHCGTEQRAVILTLLVLARRGQAPTTPKAGGPPPLTALDALRRLSRRTLFRLFRWCAMLDGLLDEREHEAVV